MRLLRISMCISRQLSPFRTMITKFCFSILRAWLHLQWKNWLLGNETGNISWFNEEETWWSTTSKHGPSISAIRAGIKTPELRFNNRNYQPEDVLVLGEDDSISGEYTDVVWVRYITRCPSRLILDPSFMHDKVHNYVNLICNFQFLMRNVLCCQECDCCLWWQEGNGMHAGRELDAKVAVSLKSDVVS